MRIGEPSLFKTELNGLTPREITQLAIAFCRAGAAPLRLAHAVVAMNLDPEFAADATFPIFIHYNTLKYIIPKHLGVENQNLFKNIYNYKCI